LDFVVFDEIDFQLGVIDFHALVSFLLDGVVDFLG